MSLACNRCIRAPLQLLKLSIVKLLKGDQKGQVTYFHLDLLTNAGSQSFLYTLQKNKFDDAVNYLMEK